jgi:hypothetical protein
MIDTLRNYLGSTLPWDLGRMQYLRLFGTVFVLVFASAVLFHLLLRDTAEPLGLLVHAGVIGAAYTAVVVLACAVLYASRLAVSRVLVWHVWLTSLAAFVGGYFFLPFDGLMPSASGGAGNHPSGDISFFQLLPRATTVRSQYVSGRAEQTSCSTRPTFATSPWKIITVTCITAVKMASGNVTWECRYAMSSRFCRRASSRRIVRTL